jgi:subtilisin-like proprotein convertase family protein
MLLGSAAGVMALTRRAFALPSGGQNAGFAWHQLETMEAIADTAVPGPYWPDTAARATAWGVTMEQEDPSGSPGAVQSGAWYSFFDDYYGLNPYFDDLVADIDSCSNSCWLCDCPSFGADFKKGTRAQRLAVLDRQVIKGGQSGILKDGYAGAVNLAKYNFFGGLVSSAGTTYVQFPTSTLEKYATGLPLTILDWNTITSTISVSSAEMPNTGAIERLQVLVSIGHTYVGDLKLTLAGPGGISKVLHDRAGGSSDNLRKMFDVPEAVGKQATGTWTLTVQDLASGDTGTLYAFGLFFTWRKPVSYAPTGGSLNERLVVNSTAGVTTIPDNATAVTNAISVVSGKTIAGMEVQLAIDHPNIGDLVVELVGPNGAVAVLENRAGGTADNIYKTYTPTSWNGLSANGTWRVRATDMVAGNAGVIQGTWSIRFKF